MARRQQQRLGVYGGKETEQYYAALGQQGTCVVDGNVFSYLESVLPRVVKDRTVLDIGCGDCWLGEKLAGYGASAVLGLDHSIGMLKRAQGRQCASVHPVMGDLRHLPFRKGRLDIVVSTFSLMYFAQEDLQEIIAEVARILAPEGRFYVATNVMAIEKAMTEKLLWQPIPVVLGFGEQKIQLENLAQPEQAYVEALCSARLNVQKVKHFEPEGVCVVPSYVWRDAVSLRKVVFEATK